MLPTLFTIWLLHFVAVASPGPNALVVSRIAADAHGRGAAFAVAGVTVGALFWSTSAILGVHLVFSAFPGMRLALQVAGGMYLLYSAWKLWRAQGAAPSMEGDAAHTLPSWVAFRQGLLTNLTNPKSALFFGSIFAAVFPPAPSLALQVATVLVVMANAAGWYGLLAWLFSRASVRQAYGRARGTVNRVAAALFGVLGLGLLVAALRDARSAP
jgi:threonine efflux protein